MRMGLFGYPAADCAVRLGRDAGTASAETRMHAARKRLIAWTGVFRNFSHCAPDEPLQFNLTSDSCLFEPVIGDNTISSCRKMWAVPGDGACSNSPLLPSLRRV